MMPAREGTLRVPGATIHYRICGTGPLLLLLHGGAGDADGTPELVDALASTFAVVSHDRRGLARSPLDASTPPPTVVNHADDAHRLLAALTNAPAFVVGSSLGALIGLELVARHHERVRVLVAHEAPAPQLLPDTERARAERDQLDVEEAYRREGMPAMRRFLSLTGVRFDDREADLAPPRPPAHYAQNIAFFLAHDAPAARLHRLDLPALRAQAARIIPAAGATDRDFWIHACARALADRLGRELIEFPGGHNGYAAHPRGFAARLHTILSAAMRDSEAGLGLDE